ncbi:MAG: ion transporter [Clostridiales bacterium]|nr:ion transporter [Clostridiales bacterium]
MRKRIFEIIEKSNGNDKWSSLYDIAIGIAILWNLIPLAFKEEPALFVSTDHLLAIVFIGDYLLRLSTADYKYEEKYNSRTWKAFFRYPFSAMAIVDFIAILPSLYIINNGWRLLRIVRLIKVLRIMRIFKTFRYSKNFETLVRIMMDSKDALIVVGMLAIWYILVSALIIFQVEPDTFDTFFDAVYWATVSLTTVGYGDIYPVSSIGRVVTMISSVFGIAIVALPAGIITAEYMTDLNNILDDDNKDNAENCSKNDDAEDIFTDDTVSGGSADNPTDDKYADNDPADDTVNDNHAGNVTDDEQADGVANIGHSGSVTDGKQADGVANIGHSGSITDGEQADGVAKGGHSGSVMDGECTDSYTDLSYTLDILITNMTSQK